MEGVEKRASEIFRITEEIIVSDKTGQTFGEESVQQHRLEEAEARDRVRERKARTRRLIQEGAILEKAFSQSTEVDKSLSTQDNQHTQEELKFIQNMRRETLTWA